MMFEKAERVVNLSEMYFWCRTTTGQGIAADYVIQQIAKECLL